ncbi:MAG: deoxyribonuclease [Coxiella sp. RIFCSPHIGHO2_12_FULL_42_15]|nr:MAG: deoxyribonuclease [Coxiella sp. RIFCSPHIGHO2_12_FULL_42_15]
MLVDSHCHLNMLDLENYGGELSTVIETAKRAGVEYILCVGVDLETAQEVLDIAVRFDNVWASVGLHPSHKTAHEPSEKDYLALAKHPKVVAIGETGLDYYYNKENLEEMRQRFRTQIRAARKANKPLIIHTRDARDDTLQIMQQEQASEVRGVMHCFTESWEMAEKAMALGFYISFSGIVTFGNAKNVVSVAEKVPLDRLLIETDSPYLTPVPFRGKPNGPQYVRYVADRIAELKAMDFSLVASQTTANFFQLFRDAKPL